ncbi:MAG: DNA mismatch repair protein MutS [Acidobacteria bacterium]|nr:DNA mismatch repair protein MutS [Acidobacteriota bacterium]
MRRVDFRSRADHVLIDATTLRHLEIIAAADGGSDGSLLGEIDRTATPMRGRLLRAWLQRPARAIETIHNRLDAVEELMSRGQDRTRLRGTLKSVHDLERLVARVALRTAGPRDLVALRQSVALIPQVRDHLAEFAAPLVRSLVAQLDDVADVREAIETTLVDEPPPLARDGGCIRDGVDHALDELRAISRDAKQQIAAMERAERERTGIAKLKVRFNRVFGYYIEVSKANLHAVPEDYQRRQTVATGERYITPALKEYEEKALGADERLLEMEQVLFEALRLQVAAEATRVLETARAIAAIDELAALAEASHTLNYSKPRVHDGPDQRISEGRHPVVERRSPTPFVPNDLLLDDATQQLVIVTGPNMGGKSTFLRQAALIVLLAHAGSFVPAAEAHVPLTDRIFARVGAADNIARGQSTFMLEMQETARILHTATSESLVLLDEIGRGTATFDGLSLAWAVAEHLATGPRARPKTLFATHYHELTAMADAVPCVANLHVVAREWQDDIIFLRRVEPGRSDRSYGIQVARLAGLPPETVQRARDILATLENDELSGGRRPGAGGQTGEGDAQLDLFRREPAAHAHILEQIRATNLDELTPLQALALLADLQRDLETPE